MTTNNSTISVASMRKTERFDLNGGMSVRAALALFFRCAERDVERSLEGQSVRLNSNTISADNLDTALRADDLITLYAAEVARGGVKGAA